MADPYFIRTVDFSEDGAVVTLKQLPKTPEDRYPASLTIPVTPEHGRSLSQYIGEPVQFFAVPTCATFDNVFTFNPRPKP